MKLRNRLTGTALVGTLAIFGLAACGSDDSDKNDSGDKDSSSNSDKSDAPDESDSEESSGDKPSKDEVVAGYSAFITETSGGQLPEELVNQLITCIVDDIYDDISDESAQALVDGNAAGVSPDDAQALATSTGTCTQELAPQ